MLLIAGYLVCLSTTPKTKLSMTKRTPEDHLSVSQNSTQILPSCKDQLVVLDNPQSTQGRRSSVHSLFKETPTLLNIWATWCLPCIEEMDELSSIKYRNPSANVVGIVESEASTEKIIKIHELIKSHGGFYPQIIDPEGKTRRCLGVPRDHTGTYPITFLFNRQGEVDTALAGSIDAFERVYISTERRLQTLLE